MEFDGTLCIAIGLELRDEGLGLLFALRLGPFFEEAMLRLLPL
jgi:hypothetical protein